MSNTLQLFLNDHPVDLTDGNPIALTFQINNLADVKNQQGNTSNQFKVPLTQNNRAILGFPDEISFTTVLPYRKYAAKAIQNGIEIIKDGFAELNSVENNMANITVLSGNVDFFDSLDGKIYDMGDSSTVYGANQPFIKPVDYSHMWSLANVVASQKKTSGWIWPVVDYGKIPADAASGEITIDVRNMRPGFFIKTAIEVMIANIGYKAKGSLLSNPLYPLLICQFANDDLEHGTDYQNEPDLDGINVSISPNLNVDHPNDSQPDGIIYWNSINSDPHQQFVGGNLYVPKKLVSIEATIRIPALELFGRYNGNHPTYLVVSLMLNDNMGGSTELANYTFDFNGAFTPITDTVHDIMMGRARTTIKNAVISATTEMAVGQVLQVIYQFKGDNPAAFTLFAGATFEVKTQKGKLLFGETIQPERIFPDIGQIDLLKDTLQRFGIICQCDEFTKTITFASFRDIVNNIPVAKDWTGKCVDQGKSVYYQLGNYGQANSLKYKQDDNVKPNGLADDVIKIDDRTLPTSVDLFESQFAPTLNREFIGGTIAVINKVSPQDESQSYSIGTSPRILIDQKRTITGGPIAVRFTDGTGSVVVNDVISTPYFDKPDAFDLPVPYGKASLLWLNLKTTNYKELEHILKQSKKVVRWFMLTERDVNELDLLTPVFNQHDGAYFYINKIDAWVKGQPTRVELIRL